MKTLSASHCHKEGCENDDQTRAFWILVAFAYANFACVSVHGEKEAALNVTDDFSATEPDVVVHYRETYAAFPDIIRLHNFIMYPVMEMSNGEFLWMGCSPMWKIREDGTREWLLPEHKVYHETHILKNPNAKKDFLWETYTHPQLGPFDEWDIEELERGHLICILRSSPDSSQFAQAESFDYGRTWKSHRLSGIIHNRGNRPRIDKLPDGKTLVVSYGLRREAKVTAIPSFDGGRTWPADRRVTILHNPNYGPTGDFTYTAMAPSRENEYLFIYYAYPAKPGSPYRGIYGNFVPAKAFQE